MPGKKYKLIRDGETVESRLKFIYSMRKAGKTLKEIAGQVGLTTEGVRLIMINAFPEECFNFNITSYARSGRKRIPRVKIECRRCGKDVFVLPRDFKKQGRQYCDRRCQYGESFGMIKKLGLREFRRVKAHKWYWEVFRKRPDWREIVKKRNEKYKK